jgi:glycosyltransferase involved in cell wall biosynthesis
MDARREQRVIITADTVGGVWTYAVELAGALEQRGIRVALATMGGALSTAQRAQLAPMRTVELYESSFKLEWMQDAWDDVDRAGDWLLRIEREFQPDVVHLNQFAFGALPFCAPTLLVAHSCVLSWWQAVHGQAAPPAWDQYRRKVARGLEAASLVAAPTRAMLTTLVRNYGYAHAALVLPNGRNPALFRPGAKRGCILAAGRLWDAGKNLGALQAVAARLPWPVQLAGSSVHPDGGGISRFALCCLGELTAEELARRLSAAAIYALPARYEPFGLSVLEAALSGCALVLGDIPSLREVWGPAALYVAPHDYAGLEAALRRLIDDPPDRRRLGETALARALQFTPQRMADAYLAAYAMLRPALARRPGKELQCA